MSALLTDVKSKIREKRPYIEQNYPKFATFAKNAVRSSNRLKQPSFYVGIVLYPVRLLLRTSLHLFWVVYSLSGKIQGRYRATNQTWSPEEEAKIQQVVKDLKEYGIAKWEGMFSPEQIAAANALMNQLMPRSREAQRKAPPNVEGGRDPDFPVWEHTWELVEKEFNDYAGDDPNWIYGRTRSRSSNPPPSIQVFFRNPLIAEISNRYFGAKTADKRVLMEELTPSLMGDGWHVDCMGKAFKAMILTTDCGLENGPLRFKMGTHRSSAPAKKRIFYSMMRFGYSFSAVNLLECRKLPGDVTYGTGKAGDCLFFDPTGVHSGSRCLKGTRRSIVLSRHAQSFQSFLFEALGNVTR